MLRDSRIPGSSARRAAVLTAGALAVGGLLLGPGIAQGAGPGDGGQPPPGTRWEGPIHEAPVPAQPPPGAMADTTVTPAAVPDQPVNLHPDTSPRSIKVSTKETETDPDYHGKHGLRTE